MNNEFDGGKREFLTYSLGTMGLLGGLPASALAMGKIPKELVPGKSIYEMRGTVRVDGRKANSKTVVTPRSLVETGSGSYIVFVVGKDAHILRENSRVQFSGEGSLEQGLRLLTGKLMSVFGHRTRPEDKMQLQTTTATIGIRGTGVYAESYGDRSYICTCYGATSISSAKDPSISEDVVSLHHDAPRFVLAEPENGKIIVPAPVFNHTDEELILIEALVGRKPPFSNISDYEAPSKGY